MTVRSAAIAFAALVLSATAAHADDAETAVWAQSGSDAAFNWSGAKSDVDGLIHSNGSMKITGAKNDFVGGAHWVSSFSNSNDSGSNRNTFGPPPLQVAPAPWPRPYSLADYMPGGAAALAAGAAYVDLTDACLMSGPGDDDHDSDDDHDDHRYCKNGVHHHGPPGNDDDDDSDSDSDGGDGGQGKVSVSFRNESFSGRLYWAPCDISFSAKNAEGQVTIVSSGKVHLKAHKDSNVAAFSDGILTLSDSDELKAIHVNGNKSTLHGDLIAERGQIHLAGSKQTLSCGVFGNRIKVSGSQLTITGEDCGAAPVNAPPLAADDSASTAEETAVIIGLLANDSDTDGVLVPSSVTVVDAPQNGGVSIDPVTGDATYTPDANFFGVDSFTYTVADDDGAVSLPATATISVQDTNDAPQATPDAAVTDEDNGIEIDVILNDFDIDGLIDAATVTVIEAPADGTTTVDPETGIVSYTPDPDFFGEDSFRYTVADDDGALSQPAVVTITVNPVNDPPVAQPDDVSVTEDTVTALDVLANDIDVDDVLTVGNIVIDVQPASGVVSIDTVAGTISYTPDADFFGSDSFQYSLVDAGGAPSAGSSTVSITVDPVNDAPVVSDIDVTTAEDNSLLVQLSATDADGDPITFTIETQPAAGTLTGTAPNLTYTPPLNFFGSDTFTFSATDGTLTSGVATVDVTITPVNDLPVVMDQDFSTAEDTALNLTLDATDPDDSTLTFQVTSQPVNGMLTGSAPDLVYTPVANFNGADQLTFVVNDGTGDSDVATVSIDVTAVNDAPVVSNVDLTIAEDDTRAIQLSATDADGDSLTFTIVTQPAGTLSGAAPNLTYTPPLNFFGNDSFTFSASDGVESSGIATIDMTITPVNDLPVVMDQSVSTPEDTALNLTLDATDAEDDPLTFQVTAQPLNGALTGAAPDLVYTPAADFSGADEFMFVANDGSGDSAVATVSIDVSAVNDAPTADSLSVFTPEDMALGITLTGSDPENSTLNFTVTSQPSSGTLSGSATDLTYTPNLNFFGADNFEFQVDDGDLTSPAAIVGIDVSPVNDAPVATDVSVDAVAGQAVAVPLAGQDDDGDTLTFSIVTQPSNGVLSGPVTDLFYTANLGFSGTDQLTFVANDGNEDSAPGTVTLQVTDDNNAPTIDSMPVTQATLFSTYQYQVDASDADGDTLSFFLTTAPAGMTISATGLVEWQVDAVGQFDVVIDVNDGNGGSAQQAYLLDVADNSPPEFTQIPLLNAPLGQTYRSVGRAVDPDGDPVTITLTSGPTGSSLTELGGGAFEITWLAAGSVGDATLFSIAATDSNGAANSLNLNVVATGNTINNSHLGTDFWLGFGINFRNLSFGLGAMPADDPGRQLQVAIGAPEGASGLVEIPSLGFAENVNLAPGETATIDIPIAAMARQFGNVSTQPPTSRGVHVATDLPVTVAGINWAFATTDAFLVLPTSTLGTEYLVTGFREVIFGPTNIETIWMALATEDDTTVTITPVGGLPNFASAQFRDPVVVTLDRGEYWTGQALYAHAMEIVADAPVAAFAGSSCSDVPIGVSTCDHLWQQFVPTPTLASRYLAAPIATREADVYRVIASEDNTRLFIDDEYVALLDRGDKFERTIPGPVEIVGSRPIVAVQYTPGGQFDMAIRQDSLADPSMLNLAPLDAFLSDYVFVVPSGEGVFRDQPNNIIRPPIEVHHISVVVPATAAGSLVYDDSPVDTSSFVQIGSSGYLAGSMQVLPGTHRIAADEQFGVTSYGFGLDESYGYYTGLIFPDASTDLSVSVQGPSAPLVAGSEEACLAIEVRDPANALVPRARFQIDIAGTVPISFTGFADQTGMADHCYTQPTAGTDTVTVSVAGGIAVVSVDWLANTDPATNGAPGIISFPDLTLYDPTFVYDIQTVDPDGDAVTVSVTSGPPGMMWSQSTGQVTWTPVIPADRAPTMHSIELTASDPSGASTSQLFELTVFYPPLITQFPGTAFVNRFSGRLQTIMRHIGGDPHLMQGVITAGNSRTTLGLQNLDGQWGADIYPESFEWLDGYRGNNPMCRAPGSPINGFDVDTLLDDRSVRVVGSAAGPVEDTNGDGQIDNDDDIHLLFIDNNNDVILYNLTQQSIVWTQDYASTRSGVKPAMVNLDGDPEMEFVAPLFRVGMPTLLMVALDTDGTELWQSSGNLPQGDYRFATQMPVAASDLEGDGMPEILYGPQVYDSNGQFLWSFPVLPTARPRLALPLAVDLDGDGAQEVLFRNEVRAADGTLLWSIDADTGTTEPDAYHAVADIAGGPELEVISSVATASGSRMYAWDASGTLLWSVAHQGSIAVPTIADFDHDGEPDVFQPQARTMISASGVIKSEGGTGFGSAFIDMVVLDLNGDGVYERMRVTQSRVVIEDVTSDFEWDTIGTPYRLTGADRRQISFVDSDHDGTPELLMATFDGIGLFEARDGAWQLPDRDYRQYSSFDARGFAVDAYAPPAPVGLRADAWVGDPQVSGSLAGGYFLGADVVNRGTGNITEDITVSFYRGNPGVGTLLGQVTVPGLNAATATTVSVPVARADLDGVMTAELSFGGPVDQCSVDNDATGGVFTEFEIFDLPNYEYRTDRASFIYLLREVSEDPFFTTTPPAGPITLGQVYQYTPSADVNNTGESLIFTLNSFNTQTPVPAGIDIDLQTGEINWQPTFDQVGTQQFRLRARSLQNETTDQIITLEVVPRANEAPVITTTPPGALILVGQTFDYDVDATDADGDVLTYSLTTAPAGMTIDPASGVIAWAPASTQVGLHPVEVTVDDAFGGIATQSFSIQVGVVGNTPPNITSFPPTSAKATFLFQYQVIANDPDGDFLTYSVETGPAGIAIDGSGLLSWTPAASGMENVVIRVSDGQTFVDQGWTLQISDADIPLTASISVNPPVVDLNAIVSFTIGISGAAGPVSTSLTIDGVAVPVNPDGTASVIADTVGQHTATAIVSDPYASDSDSVTYTVIDPTSTSTPPVVTLVTPDFEQEVTAPLDAIGSVSDVDGDLGSWFLALQARGADPTEFTIIAQDTAEVADDVLGQIDPTMLLNGQYSVILQATDVAGNVSQDVRVIRVTGNLKIGNFSVTFEDFSAPVAGIPVTVKRTYDSRRRTENLDFGFGWTVDYQNVRLQESRDIGFSWTLIEEDLGLFSQWCVRPNGDPTVTVRMPDGEVESFVARASPECTLLVPTVDVTIVFEPTDGTDSTLEQTDFGLLRIVGNNIVDLSAPGTPIDPDSYRLTTPEGLVFSLDQDFGVRQVTEANSNTLTFSDTGIVHSQGFALTFTRDGQGRIIDITAPDGTGMTYTYDANGDLETFTDQVNNTTLFTYTDAISHYLEDIIDPRGIVVARNEYDADGRLTAIVDADGNRIEFTHDITGRIETVRDRRGNPTVYFYDDEGNVLTETNALGETITSTYDGDRNELSRTNDLGNTMSWTYDERGNQLTLTNALMQTTTSTYDPRNLLLTVVDPVGNPVMTNGYDPNNTNVLTSTDALNNTTTFLWDSAIGSCSTGASRGSIDPLMGTTTVQPQCVGPFADLPAWEEDTRGVRTTFAYDELGRRISETTTRTDESGVVQTLLTTMDYDDKGRLVSVTDPAGNVTVTEYNAIDKKQATIDANLGRTEFEYDDRGNLVLTRFPDLTIETTGYDENGNVTSRTDRLGRTTTMVYDAADRLIQTIFPDDTPGNDLDNPRVVNEYDTAGRPTATVDERGSRTEFEYDAADRRTLIRDALLQETRFEYDARGLPTAMIDALDRRTELVYDAAGQLTETIFPDDTPGDQIDNLRSSIDYDALGRETSRTDLSGLTTAFEYDETGNLSAVIDALSQRTEYAYDEQSNKISQTDAEIRTTMWAYDNAGRIVARTLPEGQRESFGYDDNGNRTSHVDFNGASHTFTYDSLNRQVSATYADGVLVTTTYTQSGEVQTVTDDRGTTSYTYDERDRLDSITYPNGKSVSYAYDNAGNRISLDTANQAVSYSFDSLNRLATVTDEAGVTTYGYDAVGNRASIDNANGTRAAYVYDALNRLTELSQFDSADVLVARHNYTLGDNGNRLQHAEMTGRVVDYAYDDLYRLTQEDVTDPVLGDRTSAWTYDAVGNRLSQTDNDAGGTTTTTYVYDNNDRLTNETAVGADPASVSYTYDDNGSTLTAIDGTSTTTYNYDSRNRLVDLNGGAVSYQYDAADIRQSETSAGLTTHYLVDPTQDFPQVIEESFDLNPFAEIRYTYGTDLISQHRRIDATTTESHTFHYDGIGSTRQLTDTGGAVTDSYTYTAFGQAEAQSGITPNDYLFTGEQFDPNLGIYYLRARYYNPGIGRFQTMDSFQAPMFEPITLHRYLYANANPTMMIDPSGNLSISETLVGLAGGATIALAATSIPFSAIGFGTHEHLYEVVTPICVAQNFGCTPEIVFRNMRLFPAPLWLVNDLGLGRLVETGDVGFAGSWVPGGFVVFTVGKRTVINTTLPAHILCCGTITRTLEVSDGVISIRTVGEGTNFNRALAILNETYGSYVFKGLDVRIQNRIWVPP